MNIVYKTFKCGENHYVYDRNYNSVIVISEEEYEILSNYSREELLKSRIYKKFQENGFLEESRLKRIEHPATYFLDIFKNRHAKQLILQVTQDCNLRCSYCFYVNEKYLGRKFSHKNMDFLTAKKAIDYFIEHSISNDEIVVSFYGGEPLLRMDLIKECVDYLSRKVTNKNVTYVLTTNGTLITQEIAQYFDEHKFDIMISLDGTKENHDSNRVFPNGKGSFDTIINNIKMIRDKFPSFFKRIHFNCVVAPNTDYKCVREYVEADELLKDSQFMTSFMQDNYTTEEITFNHNLIVDTCYGEFKVLLYFMGRLKSSDVSILFLPNMVALQKTLNSLEERLPMPEKSHHGGPCIAGVKRLFVDISGNFYPCERVSEHSELMQIGNISTGIKENKINALINFGENSKEKCLKCWAFNHCKICPADVDDLKSFNRQLKSKRCIDVKNRFLDELMNICMIKQLKTKNRAILVTGHRSNSKEVLVEQ